MIIEENETPARCAAKRRKGTPRFVERRGEERRGEERRGEAGSIASYRYLRERCIEEEQLAR